MKATRIAILLMLILATAQPARAEFLVLKIRETTADNIWFWTLALFGALVFFTLRASTNRGNKGGRSR